MYRQIYSLVFNLASPLTVGRLLHRAKQAPEYGKRISERFAIGSKIKALTKKRQGSLIWLHAVSVGEVLAAIPIVDQLIKNFPKHAILVTTTTPTGSERVIHYWGDQVMHLYLPYDFSWAIRRFVRQLSPSLLIIMETELWPNLIHHTAKSGCPIVVANARLSEKSAKGYRRFAPLIKEMLQQVTVIGAQAEADGERFISLGLPRQSLEVTGNIKFDIKVDSAALEAGREFKALLNRPIWIAASTHTGEDELVLEAFKILKAKQPDLLLIIVPRHPERFDDVARLCQQFDWQVGRRTQESMPTKEHDIFIGDTMGELLYFYSISDYAFVGGSLVPTGGHNVLEPIAMDIPVVTGPFMHNFQYVNDELLAVEGVVTVNGAADLAATILAFINEKERTCKQIKSAKQILITNRGARDKICTIVARLVE